MNECNFLSHIGGLTRIFSLCYITVTYLVYSEPPLRGLLPGCHLGNPFLQHATESGRSHNMLSTKRGLAHRRELREPACAVASYRISQSARGSSQLSDHSKQPRCVAVQRDNLNCFNVLHYPSLNWSMYSLSSCTSDWKLTLYNIRPSSSKGNGKSSIGKWTSCWMVGSGLILAMGGLIPQFIHILCWSFSCL